MKRVLTLSGIAAFAIIFLAGNAASADTAVQGPSIKVTVEADPASLPAKGGAVTYVYTVTNTGDSPLANITISDNKCAIVNFVSGDINQDGKLDTNESWRYECKTSLAETTVNSVVARGYLNQQASTDITGTTVTVGIASPSASPKVPSKVPKTGGGGVGMISDLIDSFTTFTGALGIASIAFYLRYKRK